MKLFPSGRREWLWIAIQIVVVALVATGASYYVKSMPGSSYRGAVNITDEEKLLSNRLRDHVQFLAGKIGQRNLAHYDGLIRAEEYIRNQFKSLGYDISEQEFETEGKRLQNLIAELTGDGATGVVVIGAHFDSVNGSPGANDNASGVAALLELARILKDFKPSRTVRLVAFVNEEPPYFQTAEMGSRQYSSLLRSRNEQVAAMYSIETIGCYSDSANSQKYPFPFELMYPSRGNFIGFVANTSSRSLVRQSVKTFRDTTDFPSEGVAAPGSLTGIGWSDQWSFWQDGYPGVMITDTALFRYTHYHRLTDTPERLDYDRMARVVGGIANVVVFASKADDR